MFFSDSQLIVNQVQGDYLNKNPKMIAYLDEVKSLVSKIKASEFSKFLEKRTSKLIFWQT